MSRVLVVGPSMVPTLRHGDALLVRPGASVRPGDLVIARFDYTDKDEEVVGSPDPRIVGAAAGLLEAGEDDHDGR